MSKRHRNVNRIALGAVGVAALGYVIHLRSMVGPPQITRIWVSAEPGFMGVSLAKESRSYPANLDRSEWRIAKDGAVSGEPVSLLGSVEFSGPSNGDPDHLYYRIEGSRVTFFRGSKNEAGEKGFTKMVQP